MSFALWMILVAILLPIVTAGASKAGAAGYDNSQPRAWSEHLSGWRQRANWAHRNHFEALPGFAAAVLVATLTHANPATVNLLAGVWVVSRIVYTLCYVFDRPSLRSALFGVALFCVIGLFVASA
jgi:uncharacterized MAPEG superfamily protein